MREVRALSRAGRENQILIAFQTKIFNALGNSMSAYEIARKIDVRPTSPRFRSILRVMVEKGDLIEEIMNAPSKCVGGHLPKLYALPDKFLVKRNYQKREIPVKKNGKSIGQLSLWD